MTSQSRNETARDALNSALHMADGLLFQACLATDATDAAMNLFGALMMIEDAIDTVREYFTETATPEAGTVAADIEQALLAAKRHAEIPDPETARKSVTAVMDEADQFFGDLADAAEEQAA